jgi:hypothetical protein
LPSEQRKLRQFEGESQKIKRLVADLSRGKAILQEVLAKSVAPGGLGEIVHWFHERYRVSERRG